MRSRQCYQPRPRKRASCGQGTPQQYQEIQKEIKESSLADFESWVDQWAGVIGHAEERGDTRTIYKGVKELGGKRGKPSPNLTTDADGNALTSAEDVARAWSTFLANKFSATEDEIHNRPPMEELPCTQGSEPLTREQFLRALSRMGNGKATGLDGIPVEVYKRVDIVVALDMDHFEMSPLKDAAL